MLAAVSRTNPLRRRGVRAAAAAAAALCALAACGAGAVSESATPGDAARLPPFRLAAVDGPPLGPAELSGKVVLYEFWATWCTPCHVQVEILKGLYPAARANGAEFVAIATGEPEEVVREHLARSPYPYPVLLDPREEAAAALEVLGLPTLVVADRAGRIVWRATGLTDAETLAEALERAARAPSD